MTKADTWDPKQYEIFKSQRRQPFDDLLKMLGQPSAETVIDLGCGTGELTAELHRALRARTTLGIDDSKAMLDKAGAFAGSGLSFALADIATFEPRRSFDVVFSNAALQWVGDHERVFPRLLSWVAPGGRAAVQMPYNFDHPSHRLAHEVARELFDIHDGERRLLPAERYADIFASNGFRDIDAHVQIYLHQMPGGDSVIEWTKGTLLTPYRARLGESDFAKFLAEYRKRLIGEIGEGPYLYTFKRLLLCGVRHA